MKTLADYVKACDGLVEAVTGDVSVAITGACEDSRQIRPGELFVAIQGALLDGRQYIAQAVERGAAAVLYGGEPLPVEVPSLRVNDDYAAFGRVAECLYDYPAHALKIAGITGTNGKTTSAYLLRDMLRRAGHETALIGTIGYAFGETLVAAERTTPMPLDLQKMLRDMVDSGVTHVVMEVSSHALAQRRLGTTPVAVAAFTNLTRDHGDYHATMTDYFAAKARLFLDYLSPGGTAVINGDDAYGKELLERMGEARKDVRLWSFGLAAAAQWRAEACTLTRQGGQFSLVSPAGRQALQTTLTGSYNVANLLAAAAVAQALGVPLPVIAEAAASFGGVPGRLQRLDGEQGVSVLVDYAHTDDALANVLAAVTPYKTGRLTVIFGCGGDRDRGKRPEMARAAARFADHIVVTSDNPRTEDPEQILDDIVAGFGPDQGFVRIADRRRAIAETIRQAEPGETIVIAGKGHEDYQEIQGVKHPFADVEVAREAMVTAGLLRRTNSQEETDLCTT